MRLQAYSARFTQLGLRIQHMTAWAASFDAAKSLDARCALAAITATGRSVLAADHVVVYRYVGNEYWAVGPEDHWTVLGEDGEMSPRGAGPRNGRLRCAGAHLSV